jgi:hypothetical protein
MGSRLFHIATAKQEVLMTVAEAGDAVLIPAKRAGTVVVVGKYSHAAPSGP